MEFKSILMEGDAIERSLRRITHEIIEKNHGAEHICLLGVKRRGIPLARKLAENIEQFEGTKVPVGTVDITLYRDDLSELTDLPSTQDTKIPVELRDYTIIIVDDVIYTGRTARAAIEAIFALGRPRAIQLAVLVDRGHRELPIRPDYVGKNVPTSHGEIIKVNMDEFDGETNVKLYSIE